MSKGQALVNQKGGGPTHKTQPPKTPKAHQKQSDKSIKYGAPCQTQSGKPPAVDRSTICEAPKAKKGVRFPCCYLRIGPYIPWHSLVQSICTLARTHWLNEQRRMHWYIWTYLEIAAGESNTLFSLWCFANGYSIDRRRFAALSLARLAILY